MTVRMIKGNKSADIADNAESIRLAQLEGWSLAKTKTSDTPAESVVDTVEKSTEETTTVRRGRSKSK